MSTQRTSVVVRSSRFRRKAEQIEPGEPGSWTWESLPWESDPWARAQVDANPNGMSLQDVGRLHGVSRERVRQIEAKALRNLRILSDSGRLPENLRALLASIAGSG